MNDDDDFEGPQGPDEKPVGLFCSIVMVSMAITYGVVFYLAPYQGAA